jgi:cytochrome b561
VITQLLHWSIVALVIVQVVLAERAVDLPVSLERLQLFARHKSFGMTVLVLMLLRLTWRLINPSPQLDNRPTLRNLSRATHWIFYGFLLAIPVSGWIFSSASNLSVSWFGLFTWPDLVTRNTALADSARSAHHLLVVCLLVTIGLHALAALTHHFIWRDAVLKRMLPSSKLSKPDITP